MSNQFLPSNILNNLCRQQQGCLASTRDLLTLHQYNLVAMQSAVNSQRPIQYHYMEDIPRPATGTDAPLNLYAEIGNVSEIDGSEVRVPCLSHGMSKDHNVEHGEELLCSHTNGRNNGIQSLFCSYCKHLVPKQDFAKNHVHQEETPTKNDGMGVCVKKRSVSSKCSTVRMRNHSSKAKKNKFSKRNEKLKSKGVFANGIRPTLPPVNLDPPPKKMERECNSNQVTSEKNQGQQQTFSPKLSWSHDGPEKSSGSVDNKNKKLMSKVEKFWLSLLEQRPPSDDEEAVCVWLGKVMSTSEDFEDIMNWEE